MKFIHYLLVEGEGQDLKGKVWKAINQLGLKKPNNVFEGGKGSIRNSVFVIPGVLGDRLNDYAEQLQNHFGDQATVEVDTREGTGSVSRPKDPSMIIVHFRGLDESENSETFEQCIERHYAKGTSASGAYRKCRKEWEQKQGLREQEEGEQLSPREKREQQRQQQDQIQSLQRSSDPQKRRLAQLKKRKQQLEQQIEQLENDVGQGE